MGETQKCDSKLDNPSSLKLTRMKEIEDIF